MPAPGRHFARLVLGSGRTAGEPRCGGGGVFARPGAEALLLIWIREFVDRETEPVLLEEEWRKDGERLIILYGRRRIGKTRLVAELIRGKESILHFADDTVPRLQESIVWFFGDALLATLEMRPGINSSPA